MTVTPRNTEKESDEGDSKIYFNYLASLRIFGEAVDFDEINQTLGLTPTHVHHKGEMRSQWAKKAYENDMWSYDAPVSRERPLEEHLDVLWQAIKPHAAYLKAIKEKWIVDVFCGYRSNCDQAGFGVKHTALAIFTELEIPFGVSIIVA